MGGVETLMITKGKMNQRRWWWCLMFCVAFVWQNGWEKGIIKKKKRHVVK